MVGAGMYVLAVVTFIVVLLMLIVFTACKRLVRYRRFTMMVSTGDKVVQELGRIKHFIKSEPCGKTVLRCILKSLVKNNDQVENIKSIEGVKDLTLIQYNGEYHG